MVQLLKHAPFLLPETFGSEPSYNQLLKFFIRKHTHAPEWLMIFCVFLTLFKCSLLADFGILKQKDALSMLKIPGWWMIQKDFKCLLFILHIIFLFIIISHCAVALFSFKVRGEVSVFEELTNYNCYNMTVISSCGAWAVLLLTERCIILFMA